MNGVGIGEKQEEEYPMRIVHDDQVWEVIDKVNELLKKHNLVLEDDGKRHDGFQLYRLSKEG